MEKRILKSDLEVMRALIEGETIQSHNYDTGIDIDYKLIEGRLHFRLPYTADDRWIDERFSPDSVDCAVYTIEP